MTVHDTYLFTKRAVFAYVCIAIAIALALLLGAWGSYRDLTLVRQTLWEREVSLTNSDAFRTVDRIEHELERQNSPIDLDSLREKSRFFRHRKTVDGSEEGRRFWAVVNPEGQIVVHANPALEGRRLERDWYEKVSGESGHDVFETASSALSDGKLVYCIRVPITVRDAPVGEYYTGFSVARFEAALKQERAEILSHWMLVLGGILIVVSLATVSLYYLVLNSAGYGRALGLLKLQSAIELEQLAGGLAHEIRNPLHAIRLNLHTLARGLSGGAKLPQDDVKTIVQQTDREIQRVDGLVQQMLTFATPGEAKQAKVDLVAEVGSTLRFVQQELERGGIEVREDFPDQQVMARLDPNRFRQIMLNLVINAKDELTEGGKLDLRVRQRGEIAEVSVTDNGPGVSIPDCERIFEPFYSTKDRGVGLGLALVKRFAEEMGGRIWCEANQNGGGTTFRLEIPRRQGKEK